MNYVLSMFIILLVIRYSFFTSARISTCKHAYTYKQFAPNYNNSLELEYKARTEVKLGNILQFIVFRLHSLF